MADIKTDKQAASGSLQPCSVCLELVTDGGDRSTAKLKCGHHFHLDCIGSAFNAKGTMQCPNCRHVEDGQWLFANGCRRQDELAIDGASYDEAFDIYAGVPELFLPHEDMHFGHVHWCPYRSSYPRFSLSIEEVGHSPTAYTDVVVNLLVGEHTRNFSSTHPCPFIQAQGSRSARPLVSPEGNVAARDMGSGSQHGAPVMAVGATFMQVPVQHGGSWFQPNSAHITFSGGSVHNGQMEAHPHYRSRWTRPDLDSFSGTVQFTYNRPSEVPSGAIELHGGLLHGHSHIMPSQAATVQPRLQFGQYTATNAHHRRSRVRASSQMPHTHVAYPRGGLVVHGTTNWGTTVPAGQETVVGRIEPGQTDRASMVQWRREDSHVIPLFPLEPESQRWMQPPPPPQPVSSSYQPSNLYSSDLLIQGGIRMPEGSLPNQYPVFNFSSDSQTDIGPLQPSIHLPR